MSRRRVHRTGVPGVLVIAGVLAAIATGLAQAEPRVEVIARGLEVPWALAFAPDGRLFVTERPGRIRLVVEAKLRPAPVATLPVAAAGEGGLMGLALDPAFAETGRLYVCYTTRREGELVNRVVRLAVRGDRATDEHVLLDDIPGGFIHDGCRLKFGPDGTLYATTGDGGVPERAQERRSLAGKILRLNPDGTVPSDNPFPGSPVYSLGHRNPQGLAWDWESRLWESEHGPIGHDEINRVLPGRNYGWPEAQGKHGDWRWEDPVFESGSDTWAPSGIAFLGNELFVAALRGRRLLRLGFSEGFARVVSATALLEGTHGRLREVVAGPDGALYVTTSNRDGRGAPTPDDDRILRVRP